MLGVVQNKIQAHELVFDCRRLALAPVTVVSLTQRIVERLRREVINHAVITKRCDPAMLVCLQFIDQHYVFPALRSPDKTQELATQKITAVQRREAQELRLLNV